MNSAIAFFGHSDSWCNRCLYLHSTGCSYIKPDWLLWHCINRLIVQSDESLSPLSCSQTSVLPRLVLNPLTAHYAVHVLKIYIHTYARSSLPSKNNKMTKLDKLRYGWTDKPCFKRWWTSLQGDSFTVLSTASVFIRIEASLVFILSPFYEQKVPKYVLNICMT